MVFAKDSENPAVYCILDDLLLMMQAVLEQYQPCDKFDANWCEQGLREISRHQNSLAIGLGALPPKAPHTNGTGTKRTRDGDVLDNKHSQN